MDKSGIEAITQLATQGLTVGNENFTIHHKDQVIHDLERYRDRPRFFKGTFETSVINDFCNYVNDNATAASGLFINHLAGKAKIILDMGVSEVPEWGRHKAYLALRQTPEYLAIENNNDKLMDQQKFIDFIEDYSESILFVDDELKSLGFRQSLAKFRKLKVEAMASKTSEVGNYAQHASAIEALEIKADNEAPPPNILFSFVPHEGFEPISILASIRAFSEVKKVSLKYRIIGLDLAKKAIADELIEKLTDSIDIAGLQKYIGEMDYQ